MAELVAIEPEPRAEDVIKTLELVLERAKAGEISSVAIASVYVDGRPGRTWSRVPSMTLLIGAVARMEAALIRQVDADG